MSDQTEYGNRLEEHPNWKGGRTITSHGYVMVKAPDHPQSHSNGYIYEHRLIAEQKLGRQIRSDEHVHHKNENTLDNRPENLEVLHESEHRARRHGENDELRNPGEPNPEIECACGCGATFQKYDEWERPRERLPGHTEYALSTPAKDDIMEVLQASGPIHRSDLAEQVDRSLNVVSTHLSELRNEDRAVSLGGGEWTAAGTPEAQQERETATPGKDRVRMVLEEHGALHRDDLAEKLELEVASVAGHLSDLREAGEVERVAKGTWKLAGVDLDDPVDELYPSKAEIVRTLRGRGPMKTKDLVESVEVSRNTLSGHLSDLQEKDLVSSPGFGEWDASRP